MIATRRRGPLRTALAALPSDECVLWTGHQNGCGYGLACIAGERRVGAHRHVYELLVGPIPDGLQLDHLCRVRHCVNPAHLEPVTGRMNIRRARGWDLDGLRDFCIHGHPWTENEMYTSTGVKCRSCHKATCARANARYRARQRKSA